MVVNPLKLLFELFRPKSSRSENPEATRAAHLDDDVPTMGEGKNRNLDPEALAELGSHQSFSSGAS